MANEALQRHFNENIFQREVEIYRSEDIVIPDLHVNDNQDILDLIIGKPKGIISMLDEEGLVPKGSVEGFLSKIQKGFPSHKRILFGKGLIKDFTINHFAGDVKYDAMQFMVKNKDTLAQDLSDVMSCSSIAFFAELFPSPLAESSGAGGSCWVEV